MCTSGNSIRALIFIKFQTLFKDMLPHDLAIHCVSNK